MPKIGIALAAYQPNPEYFREQLTSISKQTFQDWFCVISFDSDPAQIPEEFANDSRFKVIRNSERKKHKENFLNAVKNILRIYPDIAYIAFCDQDDIWLEKKLETLLHIIGEAPLSLVHSDLGLYSGNPEAAPSVWDFEGRKTEDSSTEHLFFRNYCTGASMLMDSQLYLQFGNIPASFTDHDHWFALISSLKGRVIPCKQILTLYRQHGGNVIGAHAKPGIANLRKTWTVGNLIQHCIQEYRSFLDRLIDFPAPENEKKKWCSVSHQLKTLVIALKDGDKVLFRRVSLVFLGRLLRFFL